MRNRPITVEIVIPKTTPVPIVLREAAPFMLFGFFVAGMLKAFVSEKLL